MTTPVPSLSDLAPAEAWALMNTCSIGRAIVCHAALPVAFPVRYILDGPDLLFWVGNRPEELAAQQGVVGIEIDRMLPGRGVAWRVMVVGEAEPVADPVRVAETLTSGLRPLTDDAGCLVRLHSLIVSGVDHRPAGARRRLPCPRRPPRPASSDSLCFGCDVS